MLDGGKGVRFDSFSSAGRGTSAETRGRLCSSGSLIALVSVVTSPTCSARRRGLDAAVATAAQRPQRWLTPSPRPTATRSRPRHPTSLCSTETVSKHDTGNPVQIGVLELLSKKCSFLPKACKPDNRPTRLIRGAGKHGHRQRRAGRSCHSEEETVCPSRARFSAALRRWP